MNTLIAQLSFTSDSWKERMTELKNLSKDGLDNFHRAATIVMLLWDNRGKQNEIEETAIEDELQKEIDRLGVFSVRDLCNMVTHFPDLSDWRRLKVKGVYHETARKIAANQIRNNERGRGSRQPDREYPMSTRDKLSADNDCDTAMAPAKKSIALDLQPQSLSLDEEFQLKLVKLEAENDRLRIDNDRLARELRVARSDLRKAEQTIRDLRHQLKKRRAVAA